MKVTKNPTFGQLYVIHDDCEYRVPTAMVLGFLAAVDLDPNSIPNDGTPIEHDSQFADEALVQCAELITVQKLADSILADLMNL